MEIRKQHRVVTSFLLGLGLMLTGLVVQAQDVPGDEVGRNGLNYPKLPCLIPEGCGNIEQAPAVECPPIYIDCAVGYAAVVDRRNCLARCVPMGTEEGRRKFRTSTAQGLEGLGAQMAAVQESLGSGDVGNASAGLDHLFSNSEGLKDAVGSGGAVLAAQAPAPGIPSAPEAMQPQPEPCGDYAPCDPAPNSSRRTDIALPLLSGVKWKTGGVVPKPGLLVAHCGDSEGCHSKPGKVVEDVTEPIFREIERQVENHDYNKDAREEYGGCRMKGTCSKGDDKATR